MEENKKGMNVLYPVLGIATLVVAIIGATFAYFSASQTANNIEGTIGAGGLELLVDSITDYYDEDYYNNEETEGQLASRGSNLIPLNLIQQEGEEDTEENPWTSQFADAMNNKCVDDNGMNICEVYRIKVTNKGTVQIDVRGTLTLSALAVGGIPENLYWKLIDVTEGEGSFTSMIDDEEVTTKYPVIGTASEIKGIMPVNQSSALNQSFLTVENTAPEGSDPVYAGANVKLDAGASKTYYVIIWLEEIGVAQDSQDASGDFTDDGIDNVILRGYKGTVAFNAVTEAGDATGVTATFNKS